MPRTPKNLIIPEDSMPIKNSRRKPKPLNSIARDFPPISLTKSPSKSILRSKRNSRSPSKKNEAKRGSRLLFFDEGKIKTFMSQVWKEMISNYGVIEQLQEKLKDTPRSRKVKKVIKTQVSFSPKKKSLRRKASKRASARRLSKSMKKIASRKVIKPDREKKKMVKTDQIRRPPRRKNAKEKAYFSTKSNLVKSEIDFIKLEKNEKSSKKKKKKKLKSRRSSTADFAIKKSPKTKSKKSKISTKSKR